MSPPRGVSTRRVHDSLDSIVDHLRGAHRDLDDAQARRFLEALLEAKRIFVMGAGRSGLVGRAFAMRLMHLGFPVYVVGETTTPSVRRGDLVVAISGSGKTLSIVELGRTAREIGARLALVTAQRQSPLADMSHAVLVVKGPPASTGPNDYLARRMRGEYKSLTPLGTLFELTAMVVLDALIAQLMALTGSRESQMKKRHAVLE
ncbi:MAG: 6-phospho-3-hexuloisomerase [Euryarchaeota archaeon]|nr:6-phospho-3-hexuloisomerase [Euryarchaeota archaeon]